MASQKPALGSPLPYGEFLTNGLNNEEPLPPNHPSIGYRVNHTMLRIRDPYKSLHFYIELMGMRTIFAFGLGPVDAYYVGYPKTPEHQTDPKKFGKETLEVLRQTEGLLELVHIKGSEKQPEGYYQNGNDPPNLGFGHVGFTVPDVPTALKRLKEHGVEVVKDLGEETTLDSIKVSRWENDRGVGVSVSGTNTELHPTFRELLKNIAFIKDPVSLGGKFALKLLY
jgi:lactoylglutathione lyase